MRGLRAVALLAPAVLAVSALTGIAAPAAATGCNVYYDSSSPECMAFDSNADGDISPDIELTWPAASVAYGAPVVVTATGTDLIQPSAVTIHWVDDNNEEVLVATVTVGPGALVASAALPSDSVGENEFHAAADDYDAAGVYLWEEYAFNVETSPSQLSSDLPPRRVVKTDATAQMATGTVSGGARPVHIQVRAKGNAWVTIAESVSNAAGAYSIPVPTFYVGSHTYRVHAPLHGGLAAVDADATGQITVKRDYKPKGSKSAYRFMFKGARWDACTPIAYALNPSRMPKWGPAEVRYALREASAATGLRFVSVGTTGFVPFAEKNKGWDNPEGIDLAFAWSNPQTVRQLSGSTIGLGGSQYSDKQLTGGGVVFDATYKDGGGRGRRVWREVYLHELGHALGLTHVTDRKQTMVSGATGNNLRYGKGDLKGLAALGAEAGACTGQSETEWMRTASGRPTTERPDAGNRRWVVLP